MQYSTKRIDKALESGELKKKIATQRELVTVNLEWLKEAIQGHRHERLIRTYLNLQGNYSSIADGLLAVEGDIYEAKRHYELAAQASAQAYQLVRAGFSHQMREGAGHTTSKRITSIIPRQRFWQMILSWHF